MEKELHIWQQAEEELTPLIDTFSTVNSNILDPFMGSGTTAIFYYTANLTKFSIKE